jgi:putative transposase
MASRWRGNAGRNTQMTLAPDKVAPMVGWELFSHDADAGIRGFGATVAEAFEGAALALAMARKRYKPEEIVAKLRQVDVLASQGQNMVDAIRQIGVSEVTYYRWRQEFGGLKSEQVKRLKDLEAVSDLTLDS